MKILVVGMGSVLSADKLAMIQEPLAENKITNYEIITGENQLDLGERHIPLECMEIKNYHHIPAEFNITHKGFINNSFKFHNTKKISK